MTIQPDPQPATHLFDVCPWLYFSQASEGEQANQQAWQAQLKAQEGIMLADLCFVSAQAAIYCDHLSLGHKSYIAAHAYLTGHISIGDNSTLNPYTTVRGKVHLGDGVRVGAHSSILGFDHVFHSLDKPIYQQGVRSQGISIADDVYIGSNVTILDGVRVGSHCIIGAGAVVTRDIPDYAVAVGNPARVIKDRRSSAPRSLSSELSSFGKTVHQQLNTLLRYYEAEVGGKTIYLQQPQHAPTVRAWADAIEIAAMFNEQAPLLSREAYISKLQDLQDPEKGIIPDPYPHADNSDSVIGDHSAAYLILSVGYALECLASQLRYPIQSIREHPCADLYQDLAALPWENRAWTSGAWIDAYGSALYHNMKYFNDDSSSLAPLMGWLHVQADPQSGLWGRPSKQGDWLQPVNGFYRLTRGTYAQFGLPLPYPEAAIDSILRHTRNRDYFRDNRGNACNVLDIIHPLWLCARQTDYRQHDIHHWAKAQLTRALNKWVDARGFSFNLEQAEDERSQPSLQGTEMWLSIIYLLADVLGLSEALGYKPKGVHRTETYPLRHSLGLNY